MTYFDFIKESMNLLNDNGYTFIGQSVCFPGTGLYHTIKHIDNKNKVELPVFEDVQVGMSIGMALKGMKVCSIFPRMDFIILAVNQIVNHLDKMEIMSDGQFKPKIIIRTAIGSVKPLFPGYQHNQDHTEAFKSMCTNIDVVKLENKEMILPAYQAALNSEKSTILVELPDLYNS